MANVVHQLGALFRSRAAERCFRRARAIEKSCIPQRQSTVEPPRSRQGAGKDHTFGVHAPWDAQEREEVTRTADGTTEHWTKEQGTRDHDRI